MIRLFWPNASLAVLTLMFICGCGRTVPIANMLGPEDAATYLTQVLDVWKNGQPSNSMMQLVPPVLVRDLDWEAGHKLIGYSVKGAPERYGHSIRINVELTVSTASNVQRKQIVRYSVSTGEMTVVMRDDTVD